MDDWQYRIRCLDPEDLSKISPSAKAMFNGKVLSGKALRMVGLYAPIQEILRSIVSVGDYSSFQILIERV